MKKIIVISIFFLITSFVFGWYKTYNLSEDTQRFRSFVELPDSRLVWIADVIDSTKKTTMLWTNADGDSLKALIYEGFKPWFIELSADSSNLILIGFQESLDSSSTVLLITDLEGMVIDTKHYRILEDTYPNTFTVCPDSGFFLSGCNYPDTRIWFLKIDNGGETQWTQIYDWGVPYSPYEAIVASDGSYYIFSSWWDTMYVFQPFYLHLNKVGEIIKEEWPPLEDRDVYSAVLSGDTAICLFGTAISDMGFYYNPWVCLIDTMLNVIWERSYDYGIDAYFHSAEIKKNGDYVTEIVLWHDIGLAWFDSHDIDTLMTMRYFTPGSLEIYGKLRLLTNGDIGLASNFRVPPSFSYNPLAFRVDSLGNHLISNISENVNRPQNLSIFAYPNPFNSAVTIAAPAGAEIEIFDLNGRCVADAELVEAGAGRLTKDTSTLRQAQGTTSSLSVSAPLNKGLIEQSETLEFYLWRPDKSLGSGVYLVRTTMKERAVSKKIIYLK